MAAKLSEAVVRRLPVYYRHVCELKKEGVECISSQELSDRLGYTASQIRQDISAMGATGVQGSGYSIDLLRAHLETLMGLDSFHTMIIVGAGNLGRAVAHSVSFRNLGFETIGIFDNNPDKLGWDIGNLTVRPASQMEAFVRDNPVDIAVLTVPRECTQEIVDRLVACGVRAFWNFAPLDVKVPKGTSLVNMHLDEGLEVLSYRMRHNNP